MLPIAAWLHGESSRQSRGGERQPVPATHQAIPVRGMGSLLAGAGSPFLRWVARKPDLSPADASRAALDAWMAATGATPDDVETICELRGWSPPPAIPEGLVIPEPAKPELPEHGPEFPEPREFPEKPPPVIVETRVLSAPPARRRVKPAEAAEQFVEWVRLSGQCGTYSSREFSELCEKFFEAEDLHPIYENVFRPALELLRDDITKSRSDDHYRSHGRHSRKRHYRWTVHESEPESSAIPWTELPERARAA